MSTAAQAPTVPQAAAVPQTATGPQGTVTAETAADAAQTEEFPGNSALETVPEAKEHSSKKKGKKKKKKKLIVQEYSDDDSDGMNIDIQDVEPEKEKRKGGKKSGKKSKKKTKAALNTCINIYTTSGGSTFAVQQTQPQGPVISQQSPLPAEAPARSRDPRGSLTAGSRRLAGPLGSDSAALKSGRDVKGQEVLIIPIPKHLQGKLSRGMRQLDQPIELPIEEQVEGRLRARSIQFGGQMLQQMSDEQQQQQQRVMPPGTQDFAEMIDQRSSTYVGPGKDSSEVGTQHPPLNGMQTKDYIRYQMGKEAAEGQPEEEKAQAAPPAGMEQKDYLSVQEPGTDQAPQGISIQETLAETTMAPLILAAVVIIIVVVVAVVFLVPRGEDTTTETSSSVTGVTGSSSPVVPHPIVDPGSAMKPLGKSKDPYWDM